jgi:DNA-binding SARP family transcriptional activator
MTGNVEFRVLGPLEVRLDGRDIHLPPRERALLTVLLLRSNELVAVSDLVDALWENSPPTTARASLKNAVSFLRKSLPAGVIETRPSGYVLHARADELDLLRFESLLLEARGTSAATRADLLRSALANWRGLPLVEVPIEHYVRAEIVRLEELRMLALEDRIDADLELGRHRDLVPELESLVKLYGVRERLWSQLMLALYRSGRQADALAAYRRAHLALVDELGIEPGPALKELQRSILVQQPGLLRATDVATTPELLERATALLPMDAGERARSLYDYGVALFRLGERLRAQAVLERALAEASAAGDAPLEELIALKLSWQRLFTIGGSAREHLGRAERAAELFARLGDGPKLARAIQDQARMLRDLGRADDAAAAFQRVVELAVANHDRWLAWFNRGSVCAALQLGSTPAQEAIAHVEETLASVDPEYGKQVSALNALGVLYAEAGRIEEARQTLDESHETSLEREEITALWINLCFKAFVEQLAGDADAQETALRRAVELSEATDDGGAVDSARAELAVLLATTGRLDEAEQHVAAARTSANVDDFLVQARSRSALALVAAYRDQHDAALVLANEAVELTAPTDWLHVRGLTLEERAQVESVAGWTSAARESLTEALALYERKGSVAAASRARERFEKAGATPLGD